MSETRAPLVLIADDDAMLVELVSHKLRTVGFSTLSAPDGEAAVAAARHWRPDLIILDAMMPLMNGYQALRLLKEDSITSSIPVVMLTARRSEADVVDGFRNGISDFIGKPFSPDELAARVTHVLRKAVS